MCERGTQPPRAELPCALSLEAEALQRPLGVAGTAGEAGVSQRPWLRRSLPAALRPPGSNRGQGCTCPGQETPPSPCSAAAVQLTCPLAGTASVTRAGQGRKGLVRASCSTGPARGLSGEGRLLPSQAGQSDSVPGTPGREERPKSQSWPSDFRGSAGHAPTNHPTAEQVRQLRKRKVLKSRVWCHVSIAPALEARPPEIKETPPPSLSAGGQGLEGVPGPWAAVQFPALHTRRETRKKT